MTGSVEKIHNRYGYQNQIYYGIFDISSTQNSLREQNLRLKGSHSDPFKMCRRDTDR
jgi:hypothetical protein